MKRFLTPKSDQLGGVCKGSQIDNGRTPIPNRPTTAKEAGPKLLR